MSDVLDINPRLPHDAGPVRCFKCGHDWVAVRHVLTKFPIECPRCGYMEGFSWDKVAMNFAEGDGCGGVRPDHEFAWHIFCLAQAEMGAGS